MNRIPEQGTEEWLALRRRYLGASDAPIIMGVSKFKDSLGRKKTWKLLWEEKLGLGSTNSDNANTRYGKEMESSARAYYEGLEGICVQPAIRFHQNVGFMMASLDGLSEDGYRAVEIKCANQADHATALSGMVPEHYYPQVQHQLMVLGLQEMDYFSFHQGEAAIVRVKRDLEYQEELLKQERKFWSFVESLEEPPLCPDDFREGSLEWGETAQQLYDVKQQIKNLQGQEKKLFEELKLMSEHPTAAAGFSLTKSMVSGRVDYKRMLQDHKIDAELYRGPPSERWTLKRS